MGAVITLAGESLIAQKHAAQQGLQMARFIFANVPGLDPAAAVDRTAGKPPVSQIVFRYPLPEGNAGYVNPNQVVYSAQIGSDVGDWDFNWIGLESTEGVLFAVAVVPVQQKRRNIPPLQIGNNLTRNFLLQFDGAQALTGLTIDAKTWQHDFTVRLAGLDQRQRLSNRDIYGRACFFSDALQVEKVDAGYRLKPGTAWVEGVRVRLQDTLPITPPALPATAWIDVALQREFNDVVTRWSVVFGTGKADYVDSAGAAHYCIPLADLVNATTLTDRRVVEPIDGPLVQEFAQREGDYPLLRARATTKGDVGLSNIPNAISDDPLKNDSQVLATSKALGTFLGANLGHFALYAQAGVYDWTVPDELKKGLVKAWVWVVGAGGGGGGGSASANYNGGGGGGGGGGCARKLIDPTGVSTVRITSGAGGTGAPNGFTAGTGGGASSFGNYCSATGGYAGNPASGGSTSSGTGAGNDGGAGIGGDLNMNGSCGTPAVAAAPPVAGATVASGAGGGTALSGGIRSSASKYGAGGGGGATAGSGVGPGKNGADGTVFIEW